MEFLDVQDIRRAAHGTPLIPTQAATEVRSWSCAGKGPDKQDVKQVDELKHFTSPAQKVWPT